MFLEEAELTGSEAVPHATPTPFSLMLSPAWMVWATPKTSQAHLLVAAPVVERRVVRMSWRRIFAGFVCGFGLERCCEDEMDG